ncbi:MAG: NAD-binding protein [Myxococcota bacterium]|nr:NAD-binding protein [Myxococcota bacterium]
MFVLRHIARRTKWTLLAIPATLVIFTLAMWMIERSVPDTNIKTLSDALWYCIVTASTVGYGDTYPVSGLGRIFGGVYILITLLFLATVIGKIQTALNEAQRLKELGMDGCQFSDHLILCGWSRITEVTVSELLAADRNVAVIVNDENQLAALRTIAGDRADQMYATVGDPSSIPVLKRAGLPRAKTAIAASQDETQNLVTSINVRSVNDECRVIVYIKREELRQTLHASGVTYVASPFELSGRLIASAAFEPEVAIFVEEVSSSQSGYDIQQFMITPESRLAGQTIGDVRARLLNADGPLLIAHARKDEAGRYRTVPNPPTDLVLALSDALICVGDDNQNDVAATELKCRQGR